MKKILLLIVFLLIGSVNAAQQVVLPEQKEQKIQELLQGATVIDKDFLKIVGQSLLGSVIYSTAVNGVVYATCQALGVHFDLSDAVKNSVIQSSIGGILYGIILACSARIGTWPKLDTEKILMPLLLAYLGVGAAQACCGAYLIMKTNIGFSLESCALAALYGIQHEKYALAGGGTLLIGWILWKRYQLYCAQQIELLKQQIKIETKVA